MYKRQVFELYEDANGNKELDAEDTLVGALKETDGGFHMAEDLLAKGYFCLLYTSRCV